MNDEPLFSSAHAALTFAFRYSMQQYEPTILARLMARVAGLGSGKGLVGLDGAAQAGFILRELDALPHNERNIIVARMSVDPKEMLTAMMALIPQATASLGTGVHNRRMVDALVQRYFGRKGNLKILAEQFGVHPNTMTQRWVCIRRMLREIEDRAMERIENLLLEAGIVG